jgi:hypothetical protein
MLSIVEMLDLRLLSTRVCFPLSHEWVGGFHLGSVRESGLARRRGGGAGRLNGFSVS